MHPLVEADFLRARQQFLRASEEEREGILKRDEVARDILEFWAQIRGDAVGDFGSKFRLLRHIDGPEHPFISRVELVWLINNYRLARKLVTNPNARRVFLKMLRRPYNAYELSRELSLSLSTVQHWAHLMWDHTLTRIYTSPRIRGNVIYFTLDNARFGVLVYFLYRFIRDQLEREQIEGRRQ
ncbi:MAG: hypothetical protein QXQ87_06865 [Halobacteria archaeon]